MKKISLVFIIIAVFSCTYILLGNAQDAQGPEKQETKSFDVNNDGRADLTYYGDGKYVTKIEADTNYDGRPDVVVHTKDGKFESAEIDTDYDGKMDKKISSAGEFDKWVNENKPDFNDKLNKPLWPVELTRF